MWDEFASFQIDFCDLQENRKPENIITGLQLGVQERRKSGKFASSVYEVSNSF